MVSRLTLWAAFVGSSAAFVASPSWHAAASSRAAAAGGGRPQMVALSPGDDVMVLGGGPLMLLTAKVAANSGYRSHIVDSVDGGEYEKFLGRDFGGVDLIPPKELERLREALNTAHGLIVVSDSEATLADGLLRTATIDNRVLKRVVIMSRNAVTKEGGNGGLGGFFASAAKAGANRGVWAAGQEAVGRYRTFEAAAARRAADAGAALTIVRAGTIKGGGPGPGEDREGNSRGGPGRSNCLSKYFYDSNPFKDLINFDLLIDTDVLGVQIYPGDTAPLAGVRAVWAAKSGGQEPGDTARPALAQALTQALSQPNAEGADFAVATATSDTLPTQAEWNELFASLGQP